VTICFFLKPHYSNITGAGQITGLDSYLESIRRKPKKDVKGEILKEIKKLKDVEKKTAPIRRKIKRVARPTGPSLEEVRLARIASRRKNLRMILLIIQFIEDDD